MKPIKKFSTISTGATKSADSILESANLSPEALAELVQKLGYNNIDEVKKEKALLSKLEALLKEFAPKDDVSEDDAEDIEDEIVAMGEPKSLEDEEGEKEEDKEVGAEGEVAESDDDDDDDEEDTSDEIEKDTVEMGEPKEEPESKGDEVVTDEQPITDEVPAEGDDEESGEEVEEETEEKPVAKRRIMTFEDFCNEKEVTVNKNVSYRDDEEEEDYAVPVAEEDGEDKEEEIEHDKDAAKDDYAHIEDLKKDAADDKEEEDELEEESVNHSTSGIKSFSQFVSESYEVEEEDDSEEEEVTEEADNGPELTEETPDDNGIALKIAKGDGPETAAGIAGDTMAMGKPKKEDEKDGEELVTKDQPITKAPETSKDEPNVQGTVVVKEEEEVEAEEEETVEEAKVSEKEIKSDAEFEEYATEILKSAHGDKFDEAKAKEVIDGLKSKYSGDYGAMVGALQSSMG